MTGSSADFQFDAHLEVILSLVESDSFDESTKMKTEEPETHSCTECSKMFNTSRGMQRHFSSKHNKKGIQVFDNEVILHPKKKLEGLIQLSQ